MKTLIILIFIGLYIPINLIAQDTIPPVFNAPPADIAVQCFVDVPTMTNLGWTDNVDGSGSVTGSDVSNGLSCPETITRSWSYTDMAGNQSTISQIITINDTLSPIFTSVPADVTVDCPADVPAMTDLGWTDNCDGAGTVTGSDASDGQSCPETITRSWIYTDQCGNYVTASQTITISDDLPPTASNPDTTYVNSPGQVPPPNINVVNDAADNCGIGSVAWVGDTSDGLQPCETITRTYSITDGCGNQITVQHIIVVCSTSGIDVILNDEFLISPNPTEGIIYFGDESVGAIVTVRALNGKLIDVHKILPEDNGNYFLTGEPGMYIISIENESGIKTSRVILSK